MDTEDLRLTHKAEQTRAAMAEVAVLLFDYYTKLRAQGFTEQQAYGLALAAQSLVMGRKS